MPLLQVLRCPSEDTVRWQYYNSTKQAMYLKRGSVDSMMTLSKDMQSQLWLGVLSSTCPRCRWICSNFIAVPAAFSVVCARVWVPVRPARAWHMWGLAPSIWLLCAARLWAWLASSLWQ